MGRNYVPPEGFLTVPMIEAYLRAELEAGTLEAAFDFYERLLRRRRVPHQTVCTTLLQNTVMHHPRRALWVLETMSEQRGLDVDDYVRIVRLVRAGRSDRPASALCAQARGTRPRRDRYGVRRLGVRPPPRCSS